MRLRAGVMAIIVMVLVSTAGWAVSRTHHDTRAALSQALDVLPADARVAGFTDWAQIRETLGFDRITTALDRDSLLANAFDRDLSSRSILETHAEPMVEKFGWSVADVRWEMYGQASDGAVLAVGMNDGLEAGTVTAGLRELGYAESSGTWSVDPDALTKAVPGIPLTFSHVAVLGEERLILMSDSEAYLDRTIALHRDRGKSLAAVTAARQTATPLLGAQSAVIQVGKDACASTGLDDEPAATRVQGRNTVKPLGRLEPVAYGARAIFDRGGAQRLRFSLTFDSAATATRQLLLRRALAVGPFVGRSGQVEDLLALTSTHTSGSTATLEFGLVGDEGSFMSGDGPLLFAACSS